MVDRQTKPDQIALRIIIQLSTESPYRLGGDVPTNTHTSPSLLMLAEERFVIN
jgi:hypothetical protein